MFKREEIQSYYVHDTLVENVFINEFLPDAPGDYVKVFLFALMYADIGAKIGNEDIAKQLSLKIEEVLAAWSYWEEKGIISKDYPDKNNKFVYHVIFIGLKDKMFGTNCKSKKKKDKNLADLPGNMKDQELKELYQAIERIIGRILYGNEPLTILNWINDYEISADYILYAYDFSLKERKNTKTNYVGAVIKEWATAGLKTTEEIEEYLQENHNRHYLYKRVMKALGFMRNPTEEERRIMDVWFDDLSLGIHEVLEACKKTSGISNPNINYVNKVLTSARTHTSSGSYDDGDRSNGRLISAVMRSYEEDRKAGEALVTERREEVYKKIPKIKEIDANVRDISIEITEQMLSRKPGSDKKIESLKKKQNQLLDEKAYLLTENNYRVNYMDVPYACSVCKDEGILENGARCSCFSRKLEQKMKELEKGSFREYNER